MMRFPNILRVCVAVAALAAGACASPAANGPEQAFDVDKKFPITVQPRMMALRLPYNGQPELDQNAGGQLSRFASDYLAYGTGAISVSAPARFAGAPALVVDRLVELGVARNQIMVGTAEEDIRVTYIRYVAESPTCGNWSASLSYTASNVQHANFGCATQRNIAAQVADPRDLLTPDTSGQPDAQRRLTVLDRYRAGEPTPAERTDEQTAVISVVGGM